MGSLKKTRKLQHETNQCKFRLKRFARIKLRLLQGSCAAIATFARVPAQAASDVCVLPTSESQSRDAVYTELCDMHGIWSLDNLTSFDLLASTTP